MCGSLQSQSQAFCQARLAVPGVDSQGREEGRRGMRQGVTPRVWTSRGHGWETLPPMPRVFSPGKSTWTGNGWVSKTCISILPQCSARPVTPHELTTPRGFKRATLGSWTPKHSHSSAATPLACEGSMVTQPAPQMQTNPTSKGHFRVTRW